MTKYKAQIISNLKNIITSDYIFLDLPYYGNVGDVLIWQATLDILKEIPYKCLYSSSIETYRTPKIKKDTIIIFMGGGNFGDLWERHQVFRYKVMTEFPTNPIVQLPQSVWFESKTKQQKDIEFFNNHKNSVTIFLRDKQSYDIISTRYTKVQAYLLPDMVLGLDIKKYCQKHNIQINKGQGSLLVKRNDKEQIDILSTTIIKVDNISDWPTIKKGYLTSANLNKWLKIMNKLHLNRYKNKFIDFYYKKYIKDETIIKGINFINQYSTIYSTRLHSGILAYLLDKEVYLIDNSYHKTKGVYDLWMKDIKLVKMTY